MFPYPAGEGRILFPLHCGFFRTERRDAERRDAERRDYSNYFEADNARSIAYVAEAALLDLSDTQTGEYQYAVGSTGKYSPYTSAQRSTLEGFRGNESFTVMSYNIECYDSKNGWEGRDPAKAIQTIRDASPDIVGVQEANSNWNSYFSALTSNGSKNRSL